ncbi:MULTISPECIES: hypothetical protein [unclassified Ectothiorhodospira]|uniref:hypothetical protein n=1 Tax=unclassified Ectothiorhodospira TaxID=2684909 RepID=UPI001EE85B03|nr:MULTISPECIES: hypothetical protein [unclassified Ectothiorhodospira]MCG5515138.1 hypothetical protein [Ectothiorhodospira sp. 9100]MCG5520270.1 hypothetical protein [Ectothiorhodospira sp. 9905]
MGKEDDEMLGEYDFSHGVRGKYAERYREARNIVRLDDDVAAMFSSSQEVNEALRALGKIIRQHSGGTVEKSDQG